MNDIPYWTSPEQFEFAVTVVSCKRTDQHFEAVLDGNYIRAAEGGQAGERGLLVDKKTEAKILDTIVRDGTPTLVLDNEIAEGSKATLHIDMEWRRSLMRAHTAEHVLAAHLLKSIDGLQLGYIWLEDDHGTVRFLGPKISFDTIFEIERMVQQTISANLIVTSDLVRPDDAQTDVRSREGVTMKHETVRVVKIGDFDASACSGLHVEYTGSILFFKVTDIRYTENETTIEFSTGDKASAEVSSVYNDALARKSEYPFEMEQLGSVLDKGRMALDRYELLSESLLTVLSQESTQDRIGEISFRAYYLPGMDGGGIRNVVRQLKHEGPAARLYFVPGPKSNLVFWTDKLGSDAEHYIGEIVTKLGGRGGGSRQVFTGGFSDVESPEELYEDLVEHVRQTMSREEL
ncbi:MAG: hypothetical protein JSW61_03720 [Candidatus Thorarchaeota archaeon]|nr:MAG: hypothetical protein JSW61_03720 [Candidatus Thorarchaeota archaeon]